MGFEFIVPLNSLLVLSLFGSLLFCDLLFVNLWFGLVYLLCLYIVSCMIVNCIFSFKIVALMLGLWWVAVRLCVVFECVCGLSGLFV